MDWRKTYMSIDIFKTNTSGARWDIATEKRFSDSDGKYLEPYGFKVYSQNDEDGIISEIFSRIIGGGVDYKGKFVEFGVEDGRQSNCHYLLLKGWTGLWIEYSKECCRKIKEYFAPVIRNGRLKLANEFITRDNINKIISDNGFYGEIDLLSIDVDGNDYHIWKAIDVVRPKVVVIEYNAKLPPECKWIMPYDENHIWDSTDRHGASLLALEELGREKGYQLVGTNLNGVNAFFVRSDLAGNKFPNPATAENLYNPPRFKYLTYNCGHPSKYFLGYETEGTNGLFQFQQNGKVFIAGNGFWPEEYDNNGDFIIQWQKEKSADIFIAKPENNNYSGIKLIYSFLLPEDTNIKISIDKMEDTKKEYRLDNTKNSAGIIQYPIDFYKYNDAVKCNLDIANLWTPREVLHSEDNRFLGLGIIRVEYY